MQRIKTEAVKTTCEIEFAKFKSRSRFTGIPVTTGRISGLAIAVPYCHSPVLSNTYRHAALLGLPRPAASAVLARPQRHHRRLSHGLRHPRSVGQHPDPMGVPLKRKRRPAAPPWLTPTSTTRSRTATSPVFGSNNAFDVLASPATQHRRRRRRRFDDLPFDGICKTGGNQARSPPPAQNPQPAVFTTLDLAPSQ